MNERDFIKLCKSTVVSYVNDKAQCKIIDEDDVFVVWHCKTLQNSKAMVSTNLLDGMYFELTYNGDKKELYVDAYKKQENIVVKIPTIS